MIGYIKSSDRVTTLLLNESISASRVADVQLFISFCIAQPQTVVSEETHKQSPKNGFKMI